MRRQAAAGDAVVLSAVAPSGVARQHLIHVIGRTGLAATFGTLGPEPAHTDRLLDATLSAMREGESRAVLSPEGAWSLHLEQICSPQGWSLACEPFSGARGSVEEVVAAKAEVLARCGIVVLRGAEEGALGAEQVGLLRSAALDFGSRAISAIGHRVRREPDLVVRFSDVVTRTSHRLNIKLAELWDCGKYGFLHSGSGLHRVLEKAFGTRFFRLSHCGALLARPAPDGLPNNINQAWHRDAPEEPELSRAFDPFAFCAYIPLVDVRACNGATEFLVGSHRDGTDPAWLEGEGGLGGAAARVVSTSGLDAGDIVLFDIRTCHRGLLHADPRGGIGSLGLRPVIALNFGVEAWEDREDANNWGTMPLVPGSAAR